jgi:hypothetical protein
VKDAVGQNPDIRTHSAEKLGQQCSVQNS